MGVLRSVGQVLVPLTLRDLSGAAAGRDSQPPAGVSRQWLSLAKEHARAASPADLCGKGPHCCALLCGMVE